MEHFTFCGFSEGKMEMYNSDECILQVTRRLQVLAVIISRQHKSVNVRPPLWACWIPVHTSILGVGGRRGAFIILLAHSISTPTLLARTHVRLIPHASAELLPTLRLQAGAVTISPRRLSVKLRLPV